MRTHLQHQTQEEVEVICTFFFREIIFHENFRVNATIKVEDSLCQKILRAHSAVYFTCFLHDTIALAPYLD